MRNVQIYDTTLRDGSQGEGVNFSLVDKLAIAERLDEMGFDFIEGGYPLSNEKDAEFFQQAARLNLKHAKVCAFGMTRRRGMTCEQDLGMQALLKSEAPVITIVGKTSAFHVEEVLRVSHQENLDMIADTVRYFVEQGREVTYDAEHFFDGWKLNPEYAAKTIQAAAEAGARIVVLCDTNGGSMPEEVAALTKSAIEALKVDGIDGLGTPVGIHTHNDCEMAVANSLASVDAGAVQVQGTINGFGERCGNADLISVVGNLAFKKQGYQVLGGDKLEQLTVLSRFVYETANWRLRDSQPFVGASAFAHKGGMHVHAVNRAASSYEHIDPTVVGNERRVLVSELSGVSNIAALAEKHGIADDKDLQKKILGQVVKMENEGYQFEAAGASFDLLVKKCAGTFQPHFKRIKFHVEVGAVADEAIVTEATVKLVVGENEFHEVAEGDGPVNALDAALRKALYKQFPVLRDMSLVDYKVRVVNSEAGSAARIRVFIESTDGEDVWGTVGVSENVIEASWIALVDSVEYMLYRQEKNNANAEATDVEAVQA